MFLPEAIILLCKGFTAFHIGTFLLARIEEAQLDESYDPSHTSGPAETTIETTSNLGADTDDQALSATMPINIIRPGPGARTFSANSTVTITTASSCGMTYPLSDMRNVDAIFSPDPSARSTTPDTEFELDTPGTRFSPSFKPTSDSTSFTRLAGYGLLDEEGPRGHPESDDDDDSSSPRAPSEASMPTISAPSATSTPMTAASQNELGKAGAGTRAFTVYTDDVEPRKVSPRASSRIRDITNLPRTTRPGAPPSTATSEMPSTRPRTIPPAGPPTTTRAPRPLRKASTNTKPAYQYPAPTHCPFFSTPDIQNMDESREIWKRRIDTARRLEANQALFRPARLVSQRTKAKEAAHAAELKRKSGFIQRLSAIEHVRWDIPSEFDQYLFLLQLQAEEGERELVRDETGRLRGYEDGSSSDESSWDDDPRGFRNVTFSSEGPRARGKENYGGRYEGVGHSESRDIVDYNIPAEDLVDLTARLDDLQKKAKVLLERPGFNEKGVAGAYNTYEVDIGDMRAGR